MTGVDADDFTIPGGVLTFKNSPDFEKPSDRPHGILDFNDDGDTEDPGESAEKTVSDNMYQITIRASEMRAAGETGRALSTETHLTVQVTDRNEPGSASLNRRQPEVGTEITVSLSDPDAEMNITWQWYIAIVTSPVIDFENHWAPATGDGDDTASYTPRGDCVDGTRGGGAGVGGACPGIGNTDPDHVVDENKKLRAVATYDDRLGTGRKARVVSEFPVRAEVSSDLDLLENPANGSPGFPADGDYTRTVLESLGRGMNVGAPVGATDPNSDTLTYELMAAAPPDAADMDSFSIDMATGQVKVKSTLDWDMNGDPPDGKYKFMVVAIDPSGETAEVEVTVIAQDANDTPKILGSIATGTAPGAPSEIRVLEQDSDDRDGNNRPDATYYGTSDGMEGTPGSKMGLPVALALGNQNVFTVSDEDERGQQFWDLLGDDAGDFTLTQGGTTSTGTEGSLSGPDEPIALVFTNPPDFEMPTDANGDSVYEVILVATDSEGAEDTRTITIFVDNVPEQGMASLSVEQPYIGTEIMADVEDPDGGVGVVTWQWSKAHGTPATGEFTIIYGATSSTYTPVTDDDGAYLRVTATYIDATSDMDDPRTGTRDERVQKEATGQTPTDAKKATGGDGVTVPSDETPAGDKVFRVQATSAFAVRVEPGGPDEVTDAEFGESSYERMVAENAEVGTLVGIPIPGPKDAIYAYDLDATETNDRNYFTIDDYGQIRVGEVAYPSPIDPNIIGPVSPATAPSMEDPTLDFETDDTFVLTVRAIDMGDDARVATTRVTVKLKDLNERPYFDKQSRGAVTGDNSPIEYAESQSNRVVPLAATEPDGDSLRWEVTGVDASSFEIRDAADIVGDGKDRVELHFKSQPDFEKRGGRDSIYNVMVRATETSAVGGGPNMAAELPVMVQVMDSEEPGKVELNWLEPEVGTAITATLSDPDGDTNNISWTWYRAKVNNPNLNPSNDDTNAAFINEWEIITDLTNKNPSNPTPTGVTNVGEDSPTYTPQGDDTTVDNADNAGDVAADEGWHLLARVEYTDEHGSGKAAVGISAHKVRADVSDADNNSPDFNQDTTTRTVREDIAVGANVGDAVDVDQNEDGDTLTYQLDNDRDADTALDEAAGDNLAGNADGSNVGDVAYFSIDKATGQVKVAKKLDWDNNPEHPVDPDGKYEFWVRATDPSGEADGEDHDYIKVTVTATQVNDAPTISDGDAEISINEMNSPAKDDDVTKFVGLGYQLNPAGDAQELDPDAPNLYHRSDEDRVDRGIWPEPLAGPDGHLFEYSIPDDGIGRRLHFKKANPPDYETPMDANQDNVYEVTVVVQDNSGARGPKDVRITVNNVDEAGKLVLTPEQPDSGMPVVATLTDPDGVEYITDWKWYETSSRIDNFPTTDANNDGVIDDLVMVRHDRRIHGQSRQLRVGDGGLPGRLQHGRRPGDRPRREERRPGDPQCGGAAQVPEHE